MMKKIEPKEIQDNAVQLIGDDWMLVTAGSPEPLNPEAFLDKSIVPEWYAAGDFHKMYIVEILNVWVKE